MSGTSGRCEYVLDPNDPETWDEDIGDRVPILRSEKLGDDGCWHCSFRKEQPDEKYCIFHRGINSKEDNKVEQKMLNIMSNNEAESESIDFIGGKFGNIDISNIELSGKDIDFSFAVFDNLSINDCTLDLNISFHGARFNKLADFSNTIFKQKCVFNSTLFRGNAKFSDINEGISEYNHSEFLYDADFERAVFIEDGIFSHVEFNNANFSSCEFKSDCYFDMCSFELGAKYDDTDFYGDVTFLAVDFGSVSLDRVNIFGDVDFRGVECDQNLTIKSSNIRGYADFREVNLTGSDFTGTKIPNGDFESALMSRSQLFSTDFRGARLYGTVLGDVRIDEETRFLGHPSEDSDFSPHTFSAIRSRLTCVYDPDYEEDNEHEHRDKAKSFYRALEELGGKHARPRLQARSFVRRQDLQKQDYWEDATADDASLEERLIGGARWSRAKVARGILLYGESPWRVIVWSLGIIFGFSLLFPLGGWLKPEGGDPITYAQITSNPVEILNLVYYSTLTYTSLGFGDFKPVGWGKALTTIETGLGAVMLALLVFILGRRAAR